MSKAMFGYFDGLGATPTYDPGFEVDCPICHKRLSADMDDVGSSSIMVPDDNRSYFYRVHKKCYYNSTPALVAEIEGIIVDAIYAARNTN